jgi:hypothetical protein
LITGNTKEAQLLTYELAKALGLGEKIAKDLASLPQAANPFASWEAYLDMLMIKARQVGNLSGPIPGGGAQPMIPTNVITGGPIPGGGAQPMIPTNVAALPYMTNRVTGGGPVAGGGAQPMQVTVQIDGKAVASALQDSSLSGIGSSVNRTGR